MANREELFLLHVFYAIEVIYNSVGLLVTIAFFWAFLRVKVYHINLRWVLGSFCLCFALTSFTRILYCLTFFASEFETPDLIATVGIIRDTCLLAGALHMLVLAAERAMATWRSQTYEYERNEMVFVIFILGVWSFSYAFVFLVYHGHILRYMAAVMYAICDLTSILIMTVLYHCNFRDHKRIRRLGKLSQQYQIVENIRSSQFLYRAFAICTLFTFIGIGSYLGYALIENVILRRVSGFIFDMCVATMTPTVPLLVLTGSERLKDELRRYLKVPLPRTNYRQQSWTSVDGRVVETMVANEQQTYFKQLEESWR